MKPIYKVAVCMVVFAIVIVGSELSAQSTIPIDPSILLGQVQHISVSKNHIALMDNASKLIHVIDKKGKLVQQFRTSDCYPGLRDALKSTQFVNDSTLVIFNAIEPGVIVHLNRGCLQVFPPDLLLGDVNYFDASKNLLITKGSPRLSEKVSMNFIQLTRREQHQVHLQKQKLPRFYLRYTFNGITKIPDDNQDIYVLAQSGHDQLILFDDKGFLGQVNLQLPELNFAKDDLVVDQDVDMLSIINQVGAITSKHHVVLNVFAGEYISSNNMKLFVVFSNPTPKSKVHSTYSILECLVDIKSLSIQRHRFIFAGGSIPFHVGENEFYTFTYEKDDLEQPVIRRVEF